MKFNGFLTALLFVYAPSVDAQISDVAQLKLEGAVAFTEGPAWHPSGDVYFTDIANNRIMRREPSGVMHVFRTPSGRANGLLFDHEGNLMACEGENRRVTRTEKDGAITVLASHYQGKRFNSPNDLAVDSQGRIYFSDPRYGNRDDMEQRDEQGREIEGVYRIDGAGKISRIITHEVHRPNGILVSADDKFLFVADNVNDGPAQGLGGNRKLWRFTLRADGSVVSSSRKLLFDWGSDRGPDGMALDSKGRIFATAGFNFPKPPVETNLKYRAGVYVFSPEGTLLQNIPVPADMITNCAFGGADLRTLYVTAGHKLWSIPVKDPGYLAWPLIP
tara:strand:+ start:17173 stop:18168 length:996 start_codon:yes stop_codon:yes gene_type:complete